MFERLPPSWRIEKSAGNRYVPCLTSRTQLFATALVFTTALGGELEVNQPLTAACDDEFTNDRVSRIYHTTRRIPNC